MNSEMINGVRAAVRSVLVEHGHDSDELESHEDNEFIDAEAGDPCDEY